MLFVQKEWKRLAVLFGFCLFLYCFIFFVSYISNPNEAIIAFSRRNGMVYNFLAFMLENVITYYLLIFWMILPLIRTGRWKRFLWLLGVLYLIKLFHGFYDFRLSNTLESTNHFNESKSLIPQNSFGWFLLWFIIFSLFDIVVGVCASLIIEWMHKKRQQIILEKQKAQAELSALKHQINPHFLFNSLNFIYSKSIRFDDDLAQSVMLLSDIMRYALSIEDDKSGKVMLEKEITHLKNVIEINQKRLNNRLHINYQEQLSNKQIKIIPLVLITLVENSFKHGDLLDPAHPLGINVYDQENTLFFSIKNQKGKGAKELSNGIGLSNIKQRLNLTYGNKHHFEIQNSASEFAVLLQIPIEGK